MGQITVMHPNIHPSLADMKFRHVARELIDGAKEEIIYFENPTDGLRYLVVDRKHWMKWVEPGCPVITLFVDAKPDFNLIGNRRTSTIETLYGYNNRTGKKETYAEYERFNDGSYKFIKIKEIELD